MRKSGKKTLRLIGGGKANSSSDPKAEGDKSAGPGIEGKNAKTKLESKGAKRKVEGTDEALVVFAFRLTPKERADIHRAAGPAKASRFVRALAVAAARKDEAIVRQIMREARG